MIQRLDISGFRAAKHVVMEDLGQVNLFIGPNGSGKTSLLSAAFLFCIDADAGLLLRLAPHETSETNAEGIDRALSWMFNQGGFKEMNGKVAGKTGSQIVVSGTVAGQPRSVHVREIESTPGLVKKAKGDLDRSSSGDASVTQDLQAIRESAQLVLELTTTHNKKRSSGRLFVSPTHGVFGESPQRLARLLASFTRARVPSSDIARMLDDSQSAGIKDRIEELLRNIDPDVNHLQIGVASNGAPVVRVEHQRLGVCPLNVLGDGFGEALHFALRIRSGKFKFVMFDEFDASLHVSVLRQLANFVKHAVGDDVQLFLTTHRADTVGSFVDLVEDGWDGLRVFQTRIENGEVKVQGFGGQKLLTVWQLALDIRVPA